MTALQVQSHSALVHGSELQRLRKVVKQMVIDLATVEKAAERIRLEEGGSSDVLSAAILMSDAIDLLNNHLSA